MGPVRDKSLYTDGVDGGRESDVEEQPEKTGAGVATSGSLGNTSF